MWINYLIALTVRFHITLCPSKYNGDFLWLMHPPNFYKLYLGVSSSTPINLLRQIPILNFLFLPIGYFHKFRTCKILHAILNCEFYIFGSIHKLLQLLCCIRRLVFFTHMPINYNLAYKLQWILHLFIDHVVLR